MSIKKSISSYNETHLLLSLGLLTMLIILPTFYNIGPSSTACSLGAVNPVEASGSSSKASKALGNKAGSKAMNNRVAFKKTKSLFIPSAISLLANKKSNFSNVVKTKKKKQIVKKIEKIKTKQAKVSVAKAKIAKVYFGFNSHSLPARVKKDLAVVVKSLKENKSYRVGLKGFHDSVGSGNTAYNKSIALKRAKEVYNFFIAVGISADRIILQKPGKSLGTGANWEARRVEAYILEN